MIIQKSGSDTKGWRNSSVAAPPWLFLWLCRHWLPGLFRDCAAPAASGAAPSPPGKVVTEEVSVSGMAGQWGCSSWSACRGDDLPSDLTGSRIGREAEAASTAGERQGHQPVIGGMAEVALQLGRPCGIGNQVDV